MTYRLVVREVPEVLAKPDALQIPVSLVLSMPVFITPPKAQREVQCDLAGADKTLQVRCANHGTAYAQVREATVKRGERELARFEGGAYILPGAAKTLSLQAAGAEREPGPAELAVTFDDGKRQIFGARLP
jgi:fimbrial chaperone protein